MAKWHSASGVQRQNINNYKKPQFLLIESTWKHRDANRSRITITEQERNLNTITDFNSIPFNGVTVLNSNFNVHAMRVTGGSKKDSLFTTCIAIRHRTDKSRPLTRCSIAVCIALPLRNCPAQLWGGIYFVTTLVKGPLVILPWHRKRGNKWLQTRKA